MNRKIRQATIGVVVVVASWYAMQAFHELGHVLGALVSGGTVQRMEFPLLGFSRTDVEPNPHPLIEIWAGPIVGAFVPLILMLCLHCAARLARTIARFVAGFCLIANGAYMGVGAFFAVGDAGDLVLLGSPRWLLIVFGLITTPLGLYLWHIASTHENSDLVAPAA